jgi:hypothetical protein
MVVVVVETDTFLILIPNIPSLSLRRTKRPVVIENCGEIGEWLRSYSTLADRIDGTFINISNYLETSETVQLNN